VFRLVPLKMLPFDNKNEFQIVVDMPEGTTLEATDAVVRRFEDYLRGVPEVTHFVSYVGNASPIDFNGLVRHYYLRKGASPGRHPGQPGRQGPAAQQSHAIVLRLRKDLENRPLPTGRHQAGGNAARTAGAVHVVAEIYGDKDVSYDQLIAGAATSKRHGQEPFVTDIDDSTEGGPRDRIDFVVDKEKAALHGVSTQQIIQTLRIALRGYTPATVHLPMERQPLMINTILPRHKRSGDGRIEQIPVKSASGAMVPLAELVTPVRIRPAAAHLPQEPGAGGLRNRGNGRTGPGEAVLDMMKRLKADPMPSAPGPTGPVKGSGKSPCGCFATWASPLPRPWWASISCSSCRPAPFSCPC
jgi:multidrug efflux pump subunit AcrB